MKKKIKLKKYVVPCIIMVFVSLIAISSIITFANKDDEKGIEDIKYVSDTSLNKDVPVVSVEKVINKPFSNSDVKVAKYYYKYDDSSDTQQNSIIYYENSYIQNSGIDYILEKNFDVLCIYDGTVSKVEDNELVGKTVEIKHNNNLISVYQSLSDVKVKEGDTVTQGTIIAKSGKSKINSELGDHLHFELYVSGEVVNPEDYYNKKLSDLNM